MPALFSERPRTPDTGPRLRSRPPVPLLALLLAAALLLAGCGSADSAAGPEDGTDATPGAPRTATSQDRNDAAAELTEAERGELADSPDGSGLAVVKVSDYLDTFNVTFASQLPTAKTVDDANTARGWKKNDTAFWFTDYTSTKTRLSACITGTNGIALSWHSDTDGAVVRMRPKTCTDTDADAEVVIDLSTGAPKLVKGDQLMGPLSSQLSAEVTDPAADARLFASAVVVALSEKLAKSPGLPTPADWAAWLRARNVDVPPAARIQQVKPVGRHGFSVCVRTGTGQNGDRHGYAWFSSAKPTITAGTKPGVCR